MQIARYPRSSLDSRGIFDSGRSLQVEFILLNISHTTFRHCREHSYPSFGQPFPKQLYITGIIQKCLLEKETEKQLVRQRRLVSSVGRAPICRAGGRGFEPQIGPTLRVLK